MQGMQQTGDGKFITKLLEDQLGSSSRIEVHPERNCTMAGNPEHEFDSQNSQGHTKWIGKCATRKEATRAVEVQHTQEEGPGSGVVSVVTFSRNIWDSTVRTLKVLERKYNELYMKHNTACTNLARTTERLKRVEKQWAKLAASQEKIPSPPSETVQEEEIARRVDILKQKDVIMAEQASRELDISEHSIPREVHTGMG